MCRNFLPFKANKNIHPALYFYSHNGRKQTFATQGGKEILHFSSQMVVRGMEWNANKHDNLNLRYFIKFAPTLIHELVFELNQPSILICNL